MDCFLCLSNQENTAAAVESAILINSIAATAGSITNGINIATTDVTTDFVMQNGETIDNNVNGLVDITGLVQMTISSAGTAVDALCGSTALNGDIGADATNETILDCGGAPTLDYAEMYATGADVDYGDVVTMGTKVVNVKKINGYGQPLADGSTFQERELVKSTTAYDKKVIGIVSNNYNDFTSTGHNRIDEADHPMPVALNGRVPVKISQFSEAINQGDFITTSGDAGKAMKATRPGYMIGKALNDWAPGSGEDTLLVFVNVIWADPNSALAFDAGGNLILSQETLSQFGSPDYSNELNSLDQRITSLEGTQNEGLSILQNQLDLLTSRVDFLESEIDLIKTASGSGQLVQEATSSASFNSIVVLDDAVLPDTVINGKLDIGTLSFDNVNNSINAVGVLKIQSLGLGDIEFQGGKVNIDQVGNLVVSEGVIKGNDSFRGAAQIGVDEYEVQVLGAWDTAPVTVNVTPAYKTQVWVTDITTGGFTINVSSAPTVAKEIFWSAIW